MTLGLFGFEIDWIGTKEEGLGGLAHHSVDFTRGCRWAALHGEGGAHVVEGTASVGEFIAGVSGFEVLGEVIELDVAAGDDDLGFFVVLDVIGAQAGVLVTDIHVTIGVEDLGRLGAVVLLRGWLVRRRLRMRFWRQAWPVFFAGLGGARWRNFGRAPGTSLRARPAAAMREERICEEVARPSLSACLVKITFL